MVFLDQTSTGANAGRSRVHNRQLVLARIRAAGQIGRAEIARASGLSTQAVSNIIADLLQDGLIAEVGRKAAGRGLPAVLYALRPDGGYALGLEVRPDAVFAAVLDLCGHHLASTRSALAATDRPRVAATVQEATARVLEQASIGRSSLLGAGVAMPGPFGETGLAGSGSELPVWDDGAPHAWLSEALGLPVHVENDANAAAMAERISGVAQDFECYAYLYFGQGLGLGIVQRGQLITGAFGNAGEIGHIPAGETRDAGPLEDAVSRLSVARYLAQRGLSADSSDALERLFAERNSALMDWLQEACGPLGTAVTIVENILDPEVVILGGAMPAPILDHLIGALDMSRRSVSHRPARRTPRVLRGASGRMTATLGAAALVLNHAFTPKIAASG